MNGMTVKLISLWFWMHKYTVLHNDVPCLLLYIFKNLYIDCGELWNRASHEPGSIRQDHAL